MRKTFRRLIIAVTMLVAAIVVALGGIYFALKQPPNFYRQALAASPEASGDNVERQALALHNQLRHSGAFELQLSQEEINSWLATDLPAKFPTVLPSGVSDPRVAIDGKQLHLAVHYQRDGVDTVISLACEAWLTDQPNEVAIRFAAARAGLVPIPLSRFLAEISERAARAGLPLRWTDVNGAPTAIVRLRLGNGIVNDADARAVVLDDLAVGSGRIAIVGHTFTAAEAAESRPVTAGQPATSETRQR
jgi:hypothetical protein